MVCFSSNLGALMSEQKSASNWTEGLSFDDAVFGNDRTPFFRPDLMDDPRGESDETRDLRLSDSARRRLRRLKQKDAQRVAAAEARECQPMPAPSFERSLMCAAEADCGTDSFYRTLSAGEEGDTALNAIQGRVVELAFDVTGCRLLQSALEGAISRDAGLLIAELQGHVLEAINCPNANHVLQKAIYLCSKSDISFIADELIGVGSATARSRYGCRIMCRLLEHSALGPELTAEVLADAGPLSRHSFGRYVIQVLLEHGTPLHRREVSSALSGSLPALAKHRHGNVVLRTALLCCTPDEQLAIVEQLLAPSCLLALATNQFGSSVLVAIMELPGEFSQKAITRTTAELRLAGFEVGKSKHGRRLLQSTCPRRDRTLDIDLNTEA